MAGAGGREGASISKPLGVVLPSTGAFGSTPLRTILRTVSGTSAVPSVETENVKVNSVPPLASGAVMVFRHGTPDVTMSRPCSSGYKPRLPPSISSSKPGYDSAPVRFEKAAASLGSTSDPPTTATPNSCAAIASVEMPWAITNRVGSVVFPARREDVSQLAAPDGIRLGLGGGVLDQDIGSPVVISSSAGGRSGQKAEFLATMAAGTSNVTVFTPFAAAERVFVGRGCCCAIRLRLAITNAFAFSLLIGVASTGRGVASIFSAAFRMSVTIGDVSGGVSSGSAGSGARESVSGSIMLSPHFQVNSKSNSLNCADQRCNLLLCLSRP